MPILPTADYNADYFTGNHPAGYTDYSWSNFAQYARKDAEYINPSLYQGKRVLDIGCGKGFLVDELRRLGVFAEGIDVSGYAVGDAPAGAAPYLTVADIRNGLPSNKANTWDLIFGNGILECLTDTECVNLANACLKVGRRTVFLVWPESNPNYYNVKTLAGWKALLPPGVVIVHHLTYEVA